MKQLCADHPRLVRPMVQPIQALPRIFEVEPLDQDVLVPKPVQGISDGPRREVCSLDDVLLCQQAAGFQDLVHQFCRRRQVFDLRYFEF